MDYVSAVLWVSFAALMVLLVGIHIGYLVAIKTISRHWGLSPMSRRQGLPPTGGSGKCPKPLKKDPRSDVSLRTVYK